MIPHEENASGAGSRTEDEIMSASLEQGALGPESFDHEFKSHPDVFWPAARGEKTFEYRRDDRGGYEVGQTVRLRCYDPDHGYHGNPPLDRRITNILRGGEFELPQGYCILSLAPLSASAPASGAERMTAGEVAYNAYWLGAVCDYHDDALSIATRAAWERSAAAVLASAPATPPGVPDSLRALGEANWRCPDCNGHSFARINERQPDGTYAPGRKVRCANCKSVWEPAQPVATLEELVRLSAAAERGEWALHDCKLTDDPVRSARIRDDGGYDIVSGIVLPDAAFVVALVNWFRATHPAGQSAGSGAAPIAVVQSLKDADWSGASIGNKLLIVAAIDALEKLTAQLRERKTTPDSTRTGDGGMETEPLSLNQIEDAISYSIHVCRNDSILVSQRRLLEWREGIRAMIAARTAAPEAQGAWQGIETAEKKSRPSIIVETEITAHGRTDKVEFIAHWAEDLSGEEQPPFRGWFYATGYGFAQLPGTPKRWRPLPAPPASSGQGGR